MSSDTTNHNELDITSVSKMRNKDEIEYCGYNKDIEYPLMQTFHQESQSASSQRTSDESLRLYQNFQSSSTSPYNSNEESLGTSNDNSDKTNMSDRLKRHVSVMIANKDMHQKRAKEIIESSESSNMPTKEKLAHPKAKGNAKQLHNCEICGKAFRFRSFLKNHLMIHDHRKHFSCEQCRKSYRSKYHLQRHQKVSHTRKFSCKECGETFFVNRNFKKHVILHASNNEFKCFSCEKCGKSFCRKYYLQRHERMHRNEKPFCCEECGKTFSYSYKLKEHKLLHTDGGLSAFSCKECGRAFASKSSLKRHQETYEGMSHGFQCELCNEAFLCSNALKMHRSIHGDEQFKCNECGRIFSENKSLQLHQLTHSTAAEQWFSCDQCDRKFIRYHNLKSHQDMHAAKNTADHETLSQTCANCDANVDLQNHCNANQIVQANERPFCSESCQKAFRYKVSYSKMISKPEVQD